MRLATIETFFPFTFAHLLIHIESGSTWEPHSESKRIDEPLGRDRMFQRVSRMFYIIKITDFSYSMDGVRVIEELHATDEDSVCVQ